MLRDVRLEIIKAVVYNDDFTFLIVRVTPIYNKHNFERKFSFLIFFLLLIDHFSRGVVAPRRFFLGKKPESFLRVQLLGKSLLVGGMQGNQDGYS